MILDMSISYPSEYVFVIPDLLNKHPYAKEAQEVVNLWYDRRKKEEGKNEPL